MDSIRVAQHSQEVIRSVRIEAALQDDAKKQAGASPRRSFAWVPAYGMAALLFLAAFNFMMPERRRLIPQQGSPIYPAQRSCLSRPQTIQLYLKIYACLPPPAAEMARSGPPSFRRNSPLFAQISPLFSRCDQGMGKCAVSSITS